VEGANRAVWLKCIESRRTATGTLFEFAAAVGYDPVFVAVKASISCAPRPSRQQTWSHVHYGLVSLHKVHS